MMLHGYFRVLYKLEGDINDINILNIYTQLTRQCLEVSSVLS